MVYQRSSSCFAVAASNTNHFRPGVTACKLNFADNRSVLFEQFLNHRSLFGYSRAFDNFVGIENFLFGVVPFLPFNMMVIEYFLILFMNGRHVRYKYIKALLPGQNGSSCAALSSS